MRGTGTLPNQTELSTSSQADDSGVGAAAILNGQKPLVSVCNSCSVYTLCTWCKLFSSVDVHVLSLLKHSSV